MKKIYTLESATNNHMDIRITDGSYVPDTEIFPV